MVITPLNTNSRRKRQSNSIITTDSFAIFADLKENVLYSLVVGVRTGYSSEFLEGHPINGIIIIISTWLYNYYSMTAAVCYILPQYYVQ